MIRRYFNVLHIGTVRDKLSVYTVEAVRNADGFQLVAGLKNTISNACYAFRNDNLFQPFAGKKGHVVNGGHLVPVQFRRNIAVLNEFVHIGDCGGAVAVYAVTVRTGNMSSVRFSPVVPGPR